jgi:Phage integrase, N-terminal SAM-like domain
MRDQGQGSIRQRGKQSWELKFDLGRDPVTGKRISRFVSFKGTKREAQAELTRLLNRKNEGTYVDPTKMTLGEYLEHWLTVDIDRRVAAKTAIRHRQIVENNIKPRLGHVPVRKLTATHIEALEADLQREGYLKGTKKGQGLSAQTVLHVHRTLSQALEHAVDTDVLSGIRRGGFDHQGKRSKSLPSRRLLRCSELSRILTYICRCWSE